MKIIQQEKYKCKGKKVEKDLNTSFYICIVEVEGVSQESLGENVLIDTKIGEKNGVEEYVSLLSDEETDQYYIKQSLFGWKQVTETEKAWDLLLSFKYYVKKDVVPLIYFILSTNPTQLHDIFEFLYQNSYISIEEDD